MISREVVSQRNYETLYSAEIRHDPTHCARQIGSPNLSHPTNWRSTPLKFSGASKFGVIRDQGGRGDIPELPWWARAVPIGRRSRSRWWLRWRTASSRGGSEWVAKQFETGGKRWAWNGSEVGLTMAGGSADGAAVGSPATRVPVASGARRRENASPE